MPSGKKNTDTPKKTDSEMVPVRESVGVIEQRVTNVEKVTDTLQSLIMQGLESFGDYIEKRDQADKRQVEMEDRQHRRGVWLLVFLVSIIFILLFTSLMLKQNELFKYIVQSSIAVGAGTGIAVLLKPRKAKGTPRGD
jgi:amino acid permease